MKVRPLTDDVSVLDFDFVQAYLCRERDRLTLIDTGIEGFASEVAAAIEALNMPVSSLRQVVVTHCHDDHRGSLATLVDLTGADVLVHKSDADVVRGNASSPDPDLTDAERPYHDEIAPRVPAAEPARVDRELEDGDELELFGTSRVIGVPGHTAGSIAIYVPATRMLFTGDAAACVNGRPIVGVFNVDSALAQQSFLRLAALDFEIACFGHGPPLDHDASLAFRRTAERIAR